jgi:6-pyruvoyltetrahydropterin/6-carboxytetrahydropterin synthase
VTRTFDIVTESLETKETGFVMDLKALKEAMNAKVVKDVDHRNLNLEVPWLEGIKPSTENFAVAIWDRLADGLPDGVKLHRVYLQETQNNSVEYTGPGEG